MPSSASRFGAVLCLLLALPWILGNTGCPNAFSQFSQQTTDDALRYDMQMKIDRREYTEAIETYLRMTSAGRTSRLGRIAGATAYAGRCGLDLVTLSKTITDNIATRKLFPILLEVYKDAVVANVTDCETAEGLVRGIDSTQITADDYMLLAFISLGKIGTTLESGGADDALLDGTPDHTGTVSAGFLPCNTTPAHISDANVQRVASGLTLTLSALNSSGSDAIGSVTTQMNAVCTAIDSFLVAVGGSAGFCQQYEPTDFTGLEITAIRMLLDSTDVGFGRCGGAVGTAGCRCGIP
jgi:hypothetical protein